MRRGTRSAAAAGAASTIVFGGVAAASMVGPVPHAFAADCAGAQSLTSALSEVLDPIELLTIRSDGDISDSELAGLGYATVCTVDGVLEVVPLPAETTPPEPAPEPAPAPAPAPESAPESESAPAPESKPGTNPAPADPATPGESAASPSGPSAGESANQATRNRSSATGQTGAEKHQRLDAGRLVPAQLEQGNVGPAPARLESSLSSAGERESRTLIGPEVQRAATVGDNGLLGLIAAMSVISLGAAAAALLLRRRSNPRHLATARR